MEVTVDFLPYMEVTPCCREEKKKAKHGEMRWTPKTVKIATSEIHTSILKRNFTIL